jgi:hypothetical protein
VRLGPRGLANGLWRPVANVADGARCEWRVSIRIWGMTCLGSNTKIKKRKPSQNG